MKNKILITISLLLIAASILTTGLVSALIDLTAFTLLAFVVLRTSAKD